MPWKKTANVAQYGEGNWDNFIKKVSNTTAEEAMRIARQDPSITFFFYCRSYMALGGKAAQYSPFNAGDAVFFSGEPWYGEATQCDSYEKAGVSMIYISPNSNQQFQDITTYEITGGTPAVDFVSIFAGNYATTTVPMLHAGNNPQDPNPLNANLQDVLNAGLVQTLQSKGISVLLTVMGAHQAPGWSKFTDQAGAQAFVDYLKNDVIDPYKLDGIDIDDEFSAPSPAPNDTSLPMVATLYKQTMPDKFLTKALWNDSGPFSANWNGNTLAQHLDYGWEMSYYAGTDPNGRLSGYLGYGMSKDQLCLGFSTEPQFSGQDIETASKQTLTDGYAGSMLFGFQDTAGLSMLQNMTDGLAGPGSWMQS